MSYIKITSKFENTTFLEITYFQTAKKVLSFFPVQMCEESQIKIFTWDTDD